MLFYSILITSFYFSSATTIHWEEVLHNIVPNYIDALICVVSTGEKFFTYELKGGKPYLIGPGDLHNPKYTHMGQSVILNDIPTNVDDALSKKYTLTVYPSEKMMHAFTTNSPILVAIGFVAVIMFCTAIFFLYDFFMRDESRKRRTVLDIKRKFVRFSKYSFCKQQSFIAY